MQADNTPNWMLEALLNPATLSLIRFLWFWCFRQHLNIRLKPNFPLSALLITTMSGDMPEAQIPEDVLETQGKQTEEMQQWDTGQKELASGSVQQEEDDVEQQTEEQHKEEKQNTEDGQNVLELLQQEEKMQTHETGETEERRQDQKTVRQQTEESERQQVPVHREGEQAEKKNQDEEELHQTKVSWTREEVQQTNLEQLTKVEWQQAEMQSKEWQDSGHTLEQNQNQNHQVLFRLKGV